MLTKLFLNLVLVLGIALESVAAVPPIPQAPSATDGTSTTYVSMSWSAVSGANGYTPYRCTTTSLASCSAIRSTNSVIGFNDVPTRAGVVYYYRVRACASSECSNLSPYDTGWLLPSGATTPTATYDSSPDYVRITFVSSITPTNIYRCETSLQSSCSLLTSDAASGYQDTSAVPGVTYFYRTRWCVGNNCGAFSAYSSGRRLLVDDGPHDIHLFSPLVTAGEFNNLNKEIVPAENGQSIRVSWILENHGGSSDSLEIRHYLTRSGTVSTASILLKKSFRSVEANSLFGVVANVTTDVEPGLYNIGICVLNPGGFFCRNAGTLDIKNGNHPDIALFSPLITSQGNNNLNGEVVNVPRHSFFRVEWILENYGAASSNVGVQYYASINSTITSSDILLGTRTISVSSASPQWLSGTSANLRAKLSEGPYYIGTCIVVPTSSKCRNAGRILVVEGNPLPLAPIINLLLD